MITSMRRCVACDDLWPWPIPSRSFDLDFENRLRSVTFSVLDRLFPYLPQIITTIRGCVACQVYNKILKFKFFANLLAFTLFWLGIRYELVISMDLGFKMNWSIVWVIMGRRYPQNAGVLVVLVLIALFEALSKNLSGCYIPVPKHGYNKSNMDTWKNTTS